MIISDNSFLGHVGNIQNFYIIKFSRHGTSNSAVGHQSLTDSDLGEQLPLTQNDYHLKNRKDKPGTSIHHEAPQKKTCKFSPEKTEQTPIER